MRIAACVKLYATLAIATVFALGFSAQTAAAQVQYVFSGECSGLLHWVSVLHDRKSNSISTVIMRAKCPYHETQSFRIFRDIAIPVNLGGRFSDIIKQSGIDYYIDGTIISSSRAVLRHKGPKFVLVCGAPDTYGLLLKAPMCARFKLTARAGGQ